MHRLGNPQEPIQVHSGRINNFQQPGLRLAQQSRSFQMLYRFRVLFSLIAAITMPAYAASAQDELRRFVEDVRFLSADFKQTQSDERGKLLSSSTGRMWLARPGRFRWAYQTPYEQLMVCDGQKIWTYDQDLSQVTVRSARDALTGTPAALLSQHRALTDDFVLEDGGIDGAAHLIKLKPRSADSDFKMIELWLDHGTPARMRFLDQLGGSTDIGFSGVQTQQAGDDRLFRFAPPKGVEVIDAAGGQ